MTVTLNGFNYTGNVTNDSAEVVIPSADLNNLTEGEVILTADVLDSAGNAATQESLTFTYDATPPNITSITPDFGTYLNALDDDT